MTPEQEAALALLRNDRSISQKEVARRFGISKFMASKLDRRVTQERHNRQLTQQERAEIVELLKRQAHVNDIANTYSIRTSAISEVKRELNPRQDA